MILIVGAGFLGSYLVKCISCKSDQEILAVVKNEERIKYLKPVKCIKCDITSEIDIKNLKNICGDKTLDVFYLAACHNIDFVYENKQEAEKINLKALSLFLNSGLNIKRLIFASTDCVYGEDGGKKLKETSPLNPVNEYGRQKLLAEKKVLAKGYLCARLPFMLGESLIEKPHFYDNICKKIQEGKEVEMIDGLYRSVLSFEDTAELLYCLMNTSEIASGVINVCGDKAYSKYELGLVLERKFGYRNKTVVKKISEKEGNKFFKERRASSSVMDNSLLKKMLNLEKIIWGEDVC